MAFFQGLNSQVERDSALAAALSGLKIQDKPAERKEQKTNTNEKVTTTYNSLQSIQNSLLVPEKIVLWKKCASDLATQKIRKLGPKDVMKLSENLAAVAEFVYDLDLSYRTVSPQLMQFIARSFPNLRKINLSHCLIENDAIIPMQAFTKLEECDFSSTFLTGSTFDKLPRGIRRLKLCGCYKLTDASIAKLQDMQLEECDLSWTDITGSELDKLSRGIKKLNLRGCKNLTDAAIAKLQGMQLEECQFCETPITGSEFDKLSRGIKNLDLYHCERLVDAAIAKLAGMQLEECDLSWTEITGSELDKLSQGMKQLNLSKCNNLTADAKLQGMSAKIVR